ncbi:kynureninase [Aquicoccus sp. SCR17]|nr:kynureninase [Carideicomes alvinocaridis]
MTDFAATRAQFHLPEGVIYLDGNSLGPLPRAAEGRIAKVMRDEWGEMVITGWNRAGWMDMANRLGDRVGALIGAEPGHVVMGDTLSIKVYQALASAFELNPDRSVVLSDTGNFPSDLYMADGLVCTLGDAYSLRTVAPEELIGAIADDVAVVLVTEVDYRTGRRHDMARLIETAHAKGALVIWDLAHSAGAVDVDVSGLDADFAVGCTYKYLNGGPGAPAFIYVNPRHADVARPALSGWLGHEAPFDFDLDYRPGAGVQRMRVGTPPVLALSVLDAAMDVWDMTTMAEVRARSIELSQLFISEVERQAPMLELASPRDPEKRGSQVSFRFHEGYAGMQALIDRGVIGDFRAPDIMRFGFTPLYISPDDVREAAAIIGEVMQGALWDTAEYRKRAAVT